MNVVNKAELIIHDVDCTKAEFERGNTYQTINYKVYWTKNSHLLKIIATVEHAYLPFL
jgi:hypothetical protein